jgi:nicotinamidase-related amidase
LGGVALYPAIEPTRTALVIVDLQKGICSHWGQALATVDKDVGETYSGRVSQVVLPNVVRLLRLFRGHDMVVVYTTLGDDEIAESIRPLPARLKARREFVLHKFSSGSFATSAIDNVLR